MQEKIYSWKSKLTIEQNACKRDVKRTLGLACSLVKGKSCVLQGLDSTLFSVHSAVCSCTLMISLRNWEESKAGTRSKTCADTAREWERRKERSRGRSRGRKVKENVENRRLPCQQVDQGTTVANKSPPISKIIVTDFWLRICVCPTDRWFFLSLPVILWSKNFRGGL